jgi:hypothetical protein
MATEWGEFYRLIQPHLPGCPEIVMDNHLRDAASDLCERAEVWRYRSAAFNTQSGVSDYFVDIPGSSLLENIASLHVDGRLLKRTSDLYFEQNPTRSNSFPLLYSVFEDQLVRFFPTPDAAYEVRTTVVLKPSLTSTGVPTFIFETHAQTIACGAIASLCMIPGKEWTNVEAASYYKTKFAREVDDAKGRDFRRSNMRVRGPKFA